MGLVTDLKKALEIQAESNSNKSTSKTQESPEDLHGRLVVEKLLLQHSLEAFIVEWREFFLATMRPRFLPAGWRVDAKQTRAFGKHSRFHRKNVGSDEV